MELVKQQFNKYRNFIIYAIIGFSGVGLDMIAFVVFKDVSHINHQIANILSTSLGIINNFFWNAFFNFKTKDNLLRRFISFYTVGLVGLGVTALILLLFVDVMKLDATFVKAASIILVVIIQYTLNKKVSFKK